MNVIHSAARLTDPGRFDLTILAAGERLFLRRYRTKTATNRIVGRNGARASQAETATALGITAAQYNKLESGGRTRLPPVSADEAAKLLEALGPIDPNVGELCLIARRRSGKLLRELEAAVHASRPRYLEMERSGDAAIVAYWKTLGYRFGR